MNLYDTISAGNLASGLFPEVDTTYDGDGTFANVDYSLIGNTYGMTITSSTSSLLGYTAGLASSLASNGGPTQTLALLSTSDAIGNGGGSFLSTDQRGIAPVSCTDIGAFQLQTVTSNTASLPANSTSITINGTAFDSNTASDSVTFDNGVTGRVTAATSTSLTVSLTGLSVLTASTALHATVTVDGVSSGSAAQVATVAPVVTVSSATILSNATSLTISGHGFDTTAAAISCPSITA